MGFFTDLHNLNGCFNWMIPNHDLTKMCLTSLNWLFGVPVVVVVVVVAVGK